MSATWTVPLPWFVLVEASDRVLVLAHDDPATADGPGLRRRCYWRVGMADALARADSAAELLTSTLGDGGPAEVLRDTARWLRHFDAGSLVELDYGGLVQLVDDETLAGDTSAEDVTAALGALREGDAEKAMASYRRLRDFWARPGHPGAGANWSRAGQAPSRSRAQQLVDRGAAVAVAAADLLVAGVHDLLHLDAVVGHRALLGGVRLDRLRELGVGERGDVGEAGVGEEGLDVAAVRLGARGLHGVVPPAAGGRADGVVGEDARQRVDHRRVGVAPVPAVLLEAHDVDARVQQAAQVGQVGLLLGGVVAHRPELLQRPFPDLGEESGVEDAVEAPPTTLPELDHGVHGAGGPSPLSPTRGAEASTGHRRAGAGRSSGGEDPGDPVGVDVAATHHGDGAAVTRSGWTSAPAVATQPLASAGTPAACSSRAARRGPPRAR